MECECDSISRAFGTELLTSTTSWLWRAGSVPLGVTLGLQAPIGADASPAVAM